MITDQELAKYCVARYRLGFDYVSIYMSAVLFEKIIKQKLAVQFDRLQQVDDVENYKFDEIISKLDDESLSTFFAHAFPNVFGYEDNKALKKSLHRLRVFRNDISHSNFTLEEILDKQREQVIRLLLIICSETCPDFFRTYFGSLEGIYDQSFIASLDPLFSDYLLREVDERMIHRYDLAAIPDTQASCFDGFDSEDFNNLMALRQRMNLLRHDIELWLRQSAGRRFPYHLRTTVLTPIDTTSGYVWMPLVFDGEATSTTSRDNLVEASVSFMGTPLDFRIYLDFGGLTVDLRRTYLQFLRDERGLFADFLESMSDADQKRFFFFNIEWYASITKRWLVSELINDDETFNDEVDKAEQEIKAREFDQVQTKNRMLVGFVFDREMVGRGELDRTQVMENLEQIIMIFHQFLIYVNQKR